MQRFCWKVLHAVGTTGVKLQKAIKELAEEAEKADNWLWFQRRDGAWSSTPTLPAAVLNASLENLKQDTEL